MDEPMMGGILGSGWMKEDRDSALEVGMVGDVVVAAMVIEIEIMGIGGEGEIGVTGATPERGTGRGAGAGLIPGIGGEREAGATPEAGGTGIGVEARINQGAKAEVKHYELKRIINT